MPIKYLSSIRQTLVKRQSNSIRTAVIQLLNNSLLYVVEMRGIAFDNFYFL